jgi:hypothetical protein
MMRKTRQRLNHLDNQIDKVKWAAHDGDESIRRSINVLHRRIDGLEAVTAGEPRIQATITFTGADWQAINRKMMKWLGGGTRPAVAANAPFSITFRADKSTDLRQQVLTYAQRHEL